MLDRAQNPSFAKLLQQFFVDYLGQQKAVSRHTIAAYRDTFQLLLKFTQVAIRKAPTDLTIGDLNAVLILGFPDHLEKVRGNSVRSRNARLASIRAFLKYAAHHDFRALATIEQVLAIPMKRHDKPVVGFLSRAEIDAILNAPDPSTWTGRRDRAMLALMYNTGARVSEIAFLRLDDLVLAPSSVVHLKGKGRKQRSVPLWRQSAITLRKWVDQIDRRDGSRPLFPSATGKPLTRSSIARRLELAADKAAVALPELSKRTVSPHIIRHSTAMPLLQSGVDISVIALRLGHESPTTTHVYLSADMAMKEEALLRLQPADVGRAGYKATDNLLAFLKSL